MPDDSDSLPVLTKQRATTGRGGRPTMADAQRRQAYLIEVAGAMFMKLGFDGTSIDAVAEAASMSKRTVYARYKDKSELFSAVLRDLIERWLVPITRFQSVDAELEPMLLEIARHLLTSALAPQAVSLHRIIIGEAERRPEFGRLAHSEGRQAGVRAIAAALKRHHAELRCDDLEQAAEQFMSLVIDSSLRLAVLGIAPRARDIEGRVRAAVGLFLNGARRPGP
ncbi:MAG TPA: TetR/AcrR family transcriptional regulator C-terminal domain-containing protein [Stellaceae bacterium]|nr:TetR/AcrR family transcriptional regulator C-terminal domain-containing protein [Stellaceae bacterium]